MKWAVQDEARNRLLVIQPENVGESGMAALCAWLHDNTGWLREALVGYGALLFRGFGVKSTRDFQLLCGEIDDRPCSYVGGESPRTSLSGSVYTSTEYPAALEITLHNEMSYAPTWPRHLFFCCLKPAAQGGQTPLADSREILQKIAPDIRQRFTDRQVMYLNNYHDGWGLGKSWQQTFETTDKAAVDRFCNEHGIEHRWTDSGLWTRCVRPATVCHPVTGDAVWFNQADRWHVSSRGARKAEAMLHAMGEAGLPRHARFGDGSEIAPADLEAVRHACRQSEMVFDWQMGDVLVLDNLLTAHGRKPFSGERRVVVSMAG